jgi:hypothetical protein
MKRQINHRSLFADLDYLHPQKSHQGTVEMPFHPLGQRFRV